VTHTVTVELYYSAAWHDVTSDVRVSTPLTWSRGYSLANLKTAPGQLVGTISSVGGAWNPINPTSPIYGLVGRNTPIRISVGAQVRWVGEVSWTPMFKPGGDFYTQLAAGGLLQRLQRGTTPLKAPLDRSLAANAPDALWLLTDQATDGVGRPSTAGTQPFEGTVVGQAWAQLEGPGGAPSKALQLCAGDTLTAMLSTTLTPVDSGRWEIEACVYADIDTSASDTHFIVAHWTTSGTCDDWFLTCDRSDTPGNGQIKFEVWYRYEPGSYRGVDVDVDETADHWYHVRVSAYQSGGNQYTSIYANGSAVEDIDDPSATTGSPTQITLGPVLSGSPYFTFATSGVTAVGMSHLAVYTEAVDDHYAASTGYAGETAGERMERLGTEEGVSVTVSGTASDTTTMGPQPSASLVDLLTECAATDGGLLYESGSTLGLVYTGLVDLYRRTADLTISWADDVMPILRPALDITAARNDVTATSATLGSHRHVIETGPMSTTEPPDGIGRVDTTVNVNPQTYVQLVDIASWVAWTLCSVRPRYLELVLDLDASPALDVSGLDIGSVVEITDIPTTVDPDTPRLLVTSMEEQATTHRRTLRLGTVPAEPYDVGALGDAGAAGWADCRATTTAEALDTTETGVDVAITDSCTWTHDDGDYDVVIGGERMTVTAVSAVGGTLGAYTQTLTVTRSVNSVVKTHATGVEVHVADPLIMARR
jgi:hypothetical protein